MASVWLALGRWPGLAALLVALAAGPVGPAPSPALSPGVVVEYLRQRLGDVHDYDCLIRTETRAGTRVEAMTFRLWYRQPGMLRLRVLQGRREGSELLLDARGELRGRRGGLLRPFSRRLSRADPSLRSLRGQPAWELDFGSFVSAMRERMAMPGSSATVRPPTGVLPLLVLEVHYPQPGAPGSHWLRDVWSIDPDRWLITRGDVFDGETRVDHIEFSEVHLNPGLKESWFRF